MDSQAMGTKKYLDSLTCELIMMQLRCIKLGRGLLKSVYHHCLKEELLYRKLQDRGGYLKSCKLTIPFVFILVPF